MKNAWCLFLYLYVYLNNGKRTSLSLNTNFLEKVVNNNKKIEQINQNDGWPLSFKEKFGPRPKVDSSWKVSYLKDEHLVLGLKDEHLVLGLVDQRNGKWKKYLENEPPVW